jgi:pilus assembly protein CpaB
MKARPVLFGLIAAGLGAALFFVYARRFELEMSGGDRVDVLVAVQRIERGTPITDTLLTTRPIPQAYVDDRAIRASEREKILGLRAAETIGVSQVVFWSDAVTMQEDKRDLSALVQPGYRAVTAPFAANPTFSMIRPGDFVDVIAVEKRGTGELRDSTVLLQRVLVLAIGTDTANAPVGNKAKNPTQAPVLTLSLNLQEAQLLELAAQGGTLAVALRNPNDQRVAENLPGLDSNGLDDPETRERVRSVRQHQAPAGPVRLEGRSP